MTELGLKDPSAAHCWAYPSWVAAYSREASKAPRRNQLISQTKLTNPAVSKGRSITAANIIDFGGVFGLLVGFFS